MSFQCPVCQHNNCQNLYSGTVLHPLLGIQEGCFTTDLNYVQCQQCGHICLYPFLDQTVYDQYYSSVPSPSYQSFIYRSFVYQERVEFIEKSVNGELDGKVVEVGASRGDL